MQYMKFYVAAFLILIILGGWWFWRTFLPDSPNPSLPEEKIVIGSAKFTVEVANTTTTRATGLSFREPLSEGHGMIFKFPFAFQYGFWMRGMKFGLDLVWIKNNQVVGITRDVPPPQPGSNQLNLPIYYPPEAVDTVLEISAGEADKMNLKTGDQIRL